MASHRHHSQAVVVLAVTLTLHLAAAAEAVEFAGGTGEPNDPYQIATAEQLTAIGTDPVLLKAHFLLTADIDLDPNLPDGHVFRYALIASPQDLWQAARVRFTGTFRGGKHVIRHLHIAAAANSYSVGLFGFVGPQGRVEDLRLEDVTIDGDSRVGAVAGENWGRIARCHVQGTVRGGGFVGGLVGSNGSMLPGRYPYEPRDELPSSDSVEGLIYACSADVEVSSTVGIVRGDTWSPYLGGLVGMNGGGLIHACRCTGAVRGDGHIGGLVGYNLTGWIRSCHADCRVQGVQYVGGLTGRNEGSILFCYATGPVDANEETDAGGLSGEHQGSTYLSYWDVQTTGRASSHGGRSKSTEQMKMRETFRGWGYENLWVLADGQDYPRLAWEGLPGEPLVDEPIPYPVGTGTREDPYRISTAEQFVALAYSWPFFDKHFLLSADLDLYEASLSTPIPIGTRAIPFSGSFNGAGHTLANFGLQSPHEDYVGMFGCIGTEGLVENLTLSGGNVGGRWCVGILAASSKGTILNCRAHGCVRAEETVGGLLGSNEPNATVTSCTAAGQVMGGAHVAGLVGTNHGSITTSQSYVSVGADGVHPAGFVAMNDGLISLSCSRGFVLHCDYGASGFVGFNGNIYGQRTGEVEDCYSLVAVESSANVGGFVEANGGIVRRCYAAGYVQSVAPRGGFASSNWYSALAEGCYWDIDVSLTSASAAGVGKTSEQMRQRATFEGWDFENTWSICEGQDYPRLRWEQVACGE